MSNVSSGIDIQYDLSLLIRKLALILTKYNILTDLNTLSNSQLSEFLSELNSIIIQNSNCIQLLPSSRVELLVRILTNLIRLKFEQDQGTLNKILISLNLIYLHYPTVKLPVDLNCDTVSILITVWFDRSASSNKIKWNEDVLYQFTNTILHIIDTGDSILHDRLMSQLNINILGTLYFQCLMILLNESYLKLRLTCLKLIFEFIRLNRNPSIFHKIFPGMVGYLGQLLSRDLVKESKNVLIMSLKILIKFIPRSLVCTGVEGTKLLKSATGQSINWLETEEPSEGYNFKSHELIERLFQALIPLRSHSDDEVQRLLIQLSMTILEKCQHPSIIGNSSNLAIENLIYYLGKSISMIDRDTNTDLLWFTSWYDSQSEDMKQLLRLESEPIFKSIFEKFQTKLRTRTENEKVQIIYGLLGCLTLFGDQINSYIPFDDLLLTLCRWIKFSDERITEVQEASSNLTHNDNSNIDDELYRTMVPHLSYIETADTLKLFSKLINLIGFLGDLSDLARPCLDVYSSTTLTSFKIPSLFILLKLIQGNKMDFQLPYTSNISNDPNLIELLEMAILDRLNSIESPNNYLGLYLQLHIYWNVINHHADGFREHLDTHLYPILSKLTHSNPQLKDFTLRCLNLIKDKCHYSDLKEICIDNLDFLFNVVSNHLYEIESKGIEACYVLRGLLQLIPDKSLVLLDGVLDQVLDGLKINRFNEKVVKELLQVVEVVGKEAIYLESREYDVNSIESSSEFQSITNSSSQLQSKSRLDCSKPMKELLDELDYIYNSQQVNQSLIQELPDETNEQDENQDSLNDSNNQEASRKLNKYEEFCLRLLPPVLSFLSSDNSQHRLQCLNILGSIFKSARSETPFLQQLHQFWPSLVHRIKDPEISVAIESMKVMGQIINPHHDFLMSRVNEDLVPILLSTFNQVKLRLDSSSEYSRNHKLLTSTLQITNEIMKTKCLPNFRIRDLAIPIIEIGDKLLANINIDQLTVNTSLSNDSGSLVDILSNIRSNLKTIQDNIYIYEYLKLKYDPKLSKLESVQVPTIKFNDNDDKLQDQFKLIAISNN